jgi:precorrin-2 dehydrogenase/sirohydrochlorin ferrochelatase
MEYYPVFLNITGRPCVVIGGGEVAERKVLSLLEGGAKVTVISPDVNARIRRLASQKRIKVHQRFYEDDDLSGAFLVYSATDNRNVNLKVSREARRKGVLLNVVDVPDLCTFIVPSLVRKGALLIAISTSGKSPAMAKRIRKQLEDMFGEEYSLFLELMGAVRKKLLKKSAESDKNKVIFERLVDSPILDWIREGQRREIDCFLKNQLGDGYTTSKLRIKIGR